MNNELPDTVEAHLRQMEAAARRAHREARCGHEKEVLRQQIGEWPTYVCMLCGRIRGSVDD